MVRRTLNQFGRELGYKIFLKRKQILNTKKRISILNQRLHDYINDELDLLTVRETEGFNYPIKQTKPHKHIFDKMGYCKICGCPVLNPSDNRYDVRVRTGE